MKLKYVVITKAECKEGNLMDDLAIDRYYKHEHKKIPVVGETAYKEHPIGRPYRIKRQMFYQGELIVCDKYLCEIGYPNRCIENWDAVEIGSKEYKYCKSINYESAIEYKVFKNLDEAVKLAKKIENQWFIDNTGQGINHY